MSVNLLAICRNKTQFVVKRVKTADGVQQQLDGIFQSQEHEFFEGIDNEVKFDGGWKPEKNEILVADVTPEIDAIRISAMANLTALPELDSGNFASEDIRALAVLRGTGDGARLLLQNFSARQLLDRRFALIWDDGTFNRLTAPSFSIGTSLAGVLEKDVVKFKSFSNIKMIFDLANLYREASDTEIAAFAQHTSLAIPDVDALKGFADQTLRKLVHAVHAKGVLDTYDLAAISKAAAQQKFDLSIANGKIAFPGDKAGAKRLMQFLDESFYRGPLSGDPFISNSKRKVL